MEKYTKRELAEVRENESTPRGDSICNDIVSRSNSYGDTDILTLTDVWNILDSLHTHFLETKRDNKFLSEWMDKLYKKHPDMDTN